MSYTQRFYFVSLSTYCPDLPKPNTHPELLTDTFPLGAQSALGARNLALLAGYPRGSSLDSDSKSLKGTLSTVVIIVTVKAVNVQCNTSTLGEALQAVRNHLSAELAEPLSLQTKVNNAVGTV